MVKKKHISTDIPCQFEEDIKWFTSKLLNDIKCYGIPNHKIKLKVGVHIMLLRNIDQA